MIYIISHKQNHLPNLAFHKVLAVGGKGRNDFENGSWYSERDDDISDSIHDEISEKNASYCELTGVYWLWKHCNDRVIGICHYRRFFVKNKKWDPSLSSVLDENDINKLLSNNDLILPYIHKFGVTVLHYLFFKYGENQKQMEQLLRSVVNAKYPEYLDSYDTVMHGYKSYTWNMMICRKEVFDSYCEWLFNILFEFEEKIPEIVDYNKLTQDQKRVYGFISERLLTVWIHHNHLRIVEKPVIFTEEDRSLKGRISTWGHFNVYYFRKGTPLHFIYKIYCKLTGKNKVVRYRRYL